MKTNWATSSRVAPLGQLLPRSGPCPVGKTSSGGRTNALRATFSILIWTAMASGSGRDSVVCDVFLGGIGRNVGLFECSFVFC